MSFTVASLVLTMSIALLIFHLFLKDLYLPFSSTNSKLVNQTLFELNLVEVAFLDLYLTPGHE